MLEKYEELVGKQKVDAIHAKAKQFKGNKILYINSTKFGGGVAEILQNLIPLMKEFGLKAEWKAFSAPESFFEITKKMHNALQGNMDIEFSEKEQNTYFEQAKSIYKQIKPKGDYVIINDPQPCPVIDEVPKRKGKWIWRCHIDTANPNPQAWEMISSFLPKYDALVFTKEEYAQPGLDNLIYQMTPTIDPFSEKNKDLGKEKAEEIVSEFVPLDKPLITQVSRFDPWKDPIGVIDAYKMAKKEIDMRLAMVGSLAEDDPEGKEYLEKVKNYAKGDQDIHILTNLDGVHSLEVNAFQQVSDVILQKSTKEGFGLTVTEALWKRTPVIGGNVGGIKLQIEDGVNGFLVDTVEEAAEKIKILLNNPEKAKKMGEKGHEKVKNEFLLLSHVENYLDLFDLLKN